MKPPDCREPSPPDVESLAPFFEPRGVAVIGASATPGKLGYGVVYNLLSHGYQGQIYPVNPHLDEVLGRRCYPDIASVPDPVDLAVIIIPAKAVPAVLRACGERGVRGVVALSGGFAETGPEGQRLQEELIRIIHDYNMRLVGPNCVGVMNLHSGLDTTFVGMRPPLGPIAFLSQSGAMGGAAIDWARGRGLGFSYFASLGNTADVTETDIMARLAHDEDTHVIALYIEGFHDGRAFMHTAREVTRTTPILALKVGGTEAGARAVSSHTASLAGSNEAYRAAFKQSGVVAVDTVSQLFGAAQALAYQPPPAGKSVAVLTNAGGPGAIASDALAQLGFELPMPDEAAQAALRAALGPSAQLVNPIDMLGGASSSEYEAASRILLQSSTYDAVIAILVPNSANDPAGVAEALARAASGANKPLYACFMGDVAVREGHKRLHEHRIPPYVFPESAAHALAAACEWQCRRTRARPQPTFPTQATWPARACEIRDDLLAQGRAALTESALHPLLEALDFPVARGELARDPSEAADITKTLGAPVALKIASPQLLHKSDVGGVRLNVKSPQAAAQAFGELVTPIIDAHPEAEIQGVFVQRMAEPGVEVIVGMRRDPTFGPLILVGAGGVYVEILKDVAMRVAPLASDDARDMIRETVVGRLLRGARGRPRADVEALVDLLLRVSDLACSWPELAEFEFNPVLVHPQGRGLTIVDARAILRGEHASR
ncbi:MAG: acetate--CoA ligase family protein [Chloroflexi bacterium]|nr:acetate--CoA ligase family protein [Chloroflexota bacterium]